MKTKKRTSITIETTRLLIVSTDKNRLSWCPGCAAEVKMLTVNEAVAVARKGAGEIFRQIEDKELHYIQIPGSPVLICPNSLLK